MSKTYELSYTAERIDEMLKEVDEHTIYSDATTEEHGLMSATDKTKLDALQTAQEIDDALSEKVDKVEGKGLSQNDYTDDDKAKVASALQTETDPTVPSWAKQQNKPSYDYSEIGNTPDLSGFITKSVNDLTNYYLKSETYTKTEVAALIGAIQQFHYEIYQTLPSSGESNVLYLIGPTGSGSDKYEEYVYANNAFTKIGDTSIDLSGYVTTSALNTALADYTTTSNLTALLSNKADKVNNATNGNFAGLDANGNITDSGKKASDFATASQGANADNAILFVEQDKLTDQQRNTALANVSNQTANSTTGKMGYKILDPTKTFASQVTAENTIYEIRDVFDLNNQSVTIPENCVLKFEGGIVKNGTIVGNKTSFSGSNIQGIDSTINASGNFVGELNAYWIGAKASDADFDNSSVLQNYHDKWASYVKTLYFPHGEYMFNTPVSFNSNKRFIHIVGNGSTFNVNLAEDGQTFLTLPIRNNEATCENFRVSGVIFKNVKFSATSDWYNFSKNNALYMSRAQGFLIEDCQFWFFDTAITLVDNYYGGFDGYNAIKYCRVGISLVGNASHECNTIDIHNVEFKPMLKSLVTQLYPQEEGESDAEYAMRTATVGIDSYVVTNGTKIYGCTIESFDYGIRYNWARSVNSGSHSSENSGIVIIDSCYFENNNVYDIYLGKGNCYETYYLRYFQDVYIEKCRFYTLKKVFACDLNKLCICNNQPVTLTVQDDDYYKTSVIADDSVTTSYQNTVFTNRLTNKELNSNGNVSIVTTPYQAIKQLNSIGNVSTSIGNLLSFSGNFTDDILISQRFGINISPVLDTQFDIKPHRVYSAEGKFRVMIPSTNKVSNYTIDQAYVRRIVSVRGITIRDFLLKWNSGTNYTGYIQHLFNFPVIANPTEGTIRKQSGNTIIGFGSNFNWGNVNSGTYMLNVDTMCMAVLVHPSSGVYFWASHADVIQVFRANTEKLPPVSTSSASMPQRRLVGTTSQRSSVRKSLNAMYYDTTVGKPYIYNGYEWVECTDVLKRFDYIDQGESIANRMTEGEYNGCTFFNAATGITYTFSLSPDRTSFAWIPSIGYITSLEHPNYYDATNNPLDYSTELSAGEMVMYNGSIIKWDGTGFVNLDGSALS